MTYFGRKLILNGNVKYIGEGEDPAENPYMKAYAKSLKEVYQPERSKREDLDKLFPNGKCPFCNKGPWESLHQGCGALNTMET